jgi:hypothetical protein
MIKRVSISTIQQSKLIVARDPKELELAIYRATISVLDYYPLLAHDENSHTLYQVLHRCVTTSPDYDKLVQGMVRL